MTVLGAIFRPTQPPERLLPTARAAEAAGIDELWLWEDCFEQGGLAAAAAALASTERLRVGIGVLPVPLRNPALAAMEIASLHRMFPGRVEVGVGHGVQEWMGQVGARVESPLTLLREYLLALRALLAGETVTTEGRYVRLRDVTLHWPPHDPVSVYVAAIGPKTVALAGEVGDGLVLTSETPLDDVPAVRARFAAARPEGAAPGRITYYLPADDDAAAVAARIEQFAAAGADAVVPFSAPDDDPEAFVRYLADAVLPRVR
jgi:alkanesulfonate monooxygenase SsuD/methylene tetrahydromethanopterin reductase-like flavin-dependent oxidoreductase (luciferase family)